MPRVALESVGRYMDMINMLPVHYQGMVAANVQTIRRRMANGVRLRSPRRWR